MNFSPSMVKRSAVQLTGAVYTPPKVAAAIVAYCSARFDNNEIKVLEPSVGDGSFLTELQRSKQRGLKITAIDIDATIIASLRQHKETYAENIALHAQDFIKYAMDHHAKNHDPFNLIIGNPPFIRKHNFSSDLKLRLDDFASIYEYSKKDLKNTWAAFLLATAHMVSSDGIIAFVLPYEIMTVSYGQKILETILPMFERIDIFISDDKAFSEIDQDAVILIAKKSTAETHGLHITKVPSFEVLELKNSRKISLRGDNDRGIELNSFLLSEKTKKLLKKLREKTSTISDYADSAPGIVSAANDFFIRSKRDAQLKGVLEYGMPILKKGSFATHHPVFSINDLKTLEEREPCYLLHFQGERDQLSQSAQDYVASGEKLELHKRYKCRHRKNWYEVPLVKSEPGFFFKRSHSHPRILINEADTLITDTAYGLRVKDGFTMKGLCFSFYNSLTMLFGEMNGRFYGGGVLELTPTEFRGLPLVYHEPSEVDFEEFLNVHASANGDIEKILDFGDNWLRTSLELSEKQIKSIRNAWHTIRAHRLRHGGRPQ